MGVKLRNGRLPGMVFWKEKTIRRILQMKKVIIGTAFVALSLAPVFAAENSPPTPPNSGPGIKGEPGNKSGPAALPSNQNEKGATGAASGESGKNLSNPTQPSQDSAGVKGEPGNKSGPTVKPKSSGGTVQ